MRLLIFTATLLLLALGTRAEVVELESPAGPGSLAPSLASAHDGGLVLSWLERKDDGHALKFSLFKNGRFGPPAVIAAGEDWFANWADTPGMFVLPNGDWLAHWLVKSGPKAYAYDIVMARSADGGESWSEPLSPHRDGTRTEHGFVSYFTAAEDTAGVVWLDGRETAQAAGDDDHEGHGHSGGEAAMTLRTAAVDGAGRLTDEALLDGRVCDCCQTASALTDAGPVVVYRGRTKDETRDHWVVRRTESGWTEPKILYEDHWRIGGCPVNGPAMIADGHQVVVAWFTMAADEPQVRLALSLDAGENFELIDALAVGGALGRVDLAGLDDGFVLSWMTQQGNRAALELARYDSHGERRWQRRLEGLDAGRVSGFPRIGVTGGDSLLVVWTGTSPNSRSQVEAAEISLD